MNKKQKSENINLNHLAIALIELDPDNPVDVDQFKKSLALARDNATGPLRDLFLQGCEVLNAWPDTDPQLRQEAMSRLSGLLEQAMRLGEEIPIEKKQKKSKTVKTVSQKSLDVVISDEFEAELINEFISESMECANMAELAVLEWERNPNDRELLNTIFRGFHTIKGTSSFMHIDCIKDISHLAESMLVNVRDGQEHFTRDHASMSLKSLDVIKNILERMKLSGPGKKMKLPLDYEGVLEEVKNFASVMKKSEPETLPEKPVDQLSPQPSSDTGEKTASEQALFLGKASSFLTESTVRVKVDRLDKLLDTVGELVIVQTMVSQDDLIASNKYHEFNKKILQAGKIVRELQDLSMILRMVPLKGTFQRMARLARDLSHKKGKSINFIIEGDDIELDRSMVDMVADPLVHLIRNSIDHGIETPEERRNAGKPDQGHIYLTAGRVEGSIILTIRDDGRGLNRQKIIEKAIKSGLMDSAEGVTDQDAWEMIFQPGFSTADNITDVSGRGVGLDVVRQGVESLRGRIEVQSTEGQGCSFILRMPLTMAITDGMVVKVGSERYILPITNIQKAVKPSQTDIHTVNQRAEMFDFMGEMLPVIRLHRLFDIANAQTELTEGLLIVLGEGKIRGALFVDDLLGQTQVVTKLLGRGVNTIPGVAGGAIMSDGTVGLILDTGGIIGMVCDKTY